jgi:hypothetical protein
MKRSQTFSILHQRTREILARARAQRQELEQQLKDLEARRLQKQSRARRASLSDFYMQAEASRLMDLPDLRPTQLPDCPTCTPERRTLP